MPKIQDYQKRKYYRLSAIIESVHCLFISLISTNYKLNSFKFFLYKKPIESSLFYNKFGIIILSIKIFFSFFIPITKKKFFKMSSEENLRNDFVDSDSDDKDEFLWPVPEACKFSLSGEFESKYFDKLVSNSPDEENLHASGTGHKNSSLSSESLSTKSFLKFSSEDILKKFFFVIGMKKLKKIFIDKIMIPNLL